MSGIVLALTLLVTRCRQRRGQDRDKMTCKIARQADEHHTTLRLIGYLQAAHLEAIQAHMESNGPRTVLDLDEVRRRSLPSVWRRHCPTPMWRQPMTTTTCAADRTTLLIVDPYNDCMSAGDKLYEATSETAEQVLIRVKATGVGPC